MSNDSFVDVIYQFNKDANLLGNGYSDFLESSLLVEEAIEGFDMTSLAELLSVEPPYKPKYVSRAIVSAAVSSQSTIAPVQLSDVTRLDKACDAAIIAIGSIFKLDLTPEQASRAIHIVMQANLAKLGMPKDEHGKLMKPADFVGPEVLLQQLLDER